MSRENKGPPRQGQGLLWLLHSLYTFDVHLMQWLHGALFLT
jgi:hypothetical protein